MFFIIKMAHWKITDLQNWSSEAINTLCGDGERSNPIDVAELDLSCNDLNEIPQSVFKLTSLKKLVLHNNNLQSIPDELFGLTNLEILDLTTNEITTVPRGIKKLTKLKSIYLNWNPIRTVPIPIMEMKNVECHVYYYKQSATTSGGGTRYSNEEIQNIGRIARRGGGRPFVTEDVRNLVMPFTADDIVREAQQSGENLYVTEEDVRNLDVRPITSQSTNAVYNFLQPLTANSSYGQVGVTNMVNQLLSGLVQPQTMPLSPLLNMNFDDVFTNTNHTSSSQQPVEHPITENISTETDDDTEDV